MSDTTVQTWTDRLPTDKVAAGIAKVHADSHPALDYAGGDDNFALFLAVADNKCQRITGLSIFDLEDHPWCDEFDDGSSPSEALHGCLVANGYIRPGE